ITYEEDGGLTITVEIIEGDQYAVNNVKIEGDLIKPVDELLKKISINKEKFINREMVRRDTMVLREAYADEGYAYAEVAPLVKEDDEKKWVDITYRISHGEKVRFERINISGNSQTRDNVIRRELQVVEGGYFSGEGMRKSTRNLHRLGFFEDLEIRTVKGSRDDLMILDINVKERATGAFSLGVGYSSFDKTLAIFRVEQNNLFGRGQKILGMAKLGAKTHEFLLEFTEPWFLDRRISAGIELYNWEREYDEYTKNSLGAGLNFKIPLNIDEFTRGLVGYTYDVSDITDIEDTTAVAIKEMAGTNVTSSMNFGLERDSRDRIWNPSKGSINKVLFEYAGGILSGDVYYNKYEATSAWYFPLPWQTVFMIQGRVGYLEQRPGGKLPIYQKYQIGGINTVRGFESYSISPRDPATGDKIGGEKMMVYNLEYRFPLLKEQGLMGIFFFDAGNVYSKDENYAFSDIKKSVGTGVRWYSPVGPLRVEYGKVLGPKENEPSGNWEFTVGGFF
ncbi:MAG: outer membrane protein assembly factor BamA, partial [Pseudomonadota bacterium]